MLNYFIILSIQTALFNILRDKNVLSYYSVQLKQDEDWSKK